MVEEAVASLTVNLLATGVTAGTAVSARKARSLIRRHQVSEDIGDVATEFNKALKEAIDEEDAPELEGFTDNWGEIADELASASVTPAERRDHEEVDVLFTDEEEAVRRIAEAYATVEGFDIDDTPQLREAMEKALARAYRRAVSEFEESIAGTDLADVFQEEADLVLAESLSDLRNRLEAMESDVAVLLTQDARNEGFRQLHPAFFARQSASPEMCWRVGFSLADVEAGIPAERDGIDGGLATEELFEILRDGESRVVVGRPGSGKSTLCKQVAVRWYEEGIGDVFYRESGSSSFESTDDLERAVEQGDGHVLVCVEDVVREEANSVLEVMEVFETADDVSFLFDARREEFEEFDVPGSLDVSANRRRGGLLSDTNTKRYPLSVLSVYDVRRVCEAFEEATGREIRKDAETLHDEIRPDVDLGVGEMLLLTFLLPATDESAQEGAAEGLEAHVRARYETLHPEKDEELRDLSEFDDEMLADVGVMVNLLNATGLGIHQELVHALCHEYGYGVETHDEVESILRAFEGWFLFESEGETTWTTHELWSTLYLRELAQEHAEDQESSRRKERSEERTARCLDSIFRLFDDEEHREEIAHEFPGSGVLEAIASEPQEEADEYLVSVFGLGLDWPALAPLFGTDDTAQYKLPEMASENYIGWAVTARGYAHYSRGAYEKAKSEYEYRLNQSREAGDRQEEAEILDLLGNIVQFRGNYDKAEKYYQDSLEISREVGDRNEGARSLSNLGFVAQSRGNYDKAEKYHKKSLKINREMGNRTEEARNLNNLGFVADARGRYEKAWKYHKESLKIKREIGDRQGEATSLGNLGNVARSRGDYDKAEKYYQDSLEISREIGYKRGDVMGLGGLGLIAQSRGNYDRAEKYYQDSLEISREIGYKRGEVKGLSNLGAVAYARGGYDEAREYYQGSLEMSREIGDKDEEAKILSNLGLIAQSRENYDKAEKYHKDSLKIKREIGDRQGEATSLSNLGNVARSRENYDKAREYCQNSLEIVREIGDKDEEAKSLGILGLIASKQGEYDEARNFFISARDLLRQTEMITMEILARRNLIEVELEAGETKEARDRLEAAFERLNEIDEELPEEREKLEELRDEILER